MRTVLVTGGCGFIGAAIVNALADAGHNVISVDWNTRRFRSDVRFIHADITDPRTLAQYSHEVDTIIHSASVVHTRRTNKRVVWHVNYKGTLAVLDACRLNCIPSLVHISSASVVYAGCDIQNGDESLPYSSRSLAPYADSKIAAERAVLEFGVDSPTRVCALRPHIVFGANDNRFIPNIIERAELGVLRRRVRSPRSLSDFTYIDNFTQAVMTVEDRLSHDDRLDGQTYFITNGEPTPFYDFVQQFLAEMGYPPISTTIPAWIAFTGAALYEFWEWIRARELRPEDGISRFTIRYLTTHHYFSNKKAEQDFGYKPTVPLSEGIRRTVSSLQNGEGERTRVFVPRQTLV